MGSITAIFSALSNGFKLGLTIFQARNTPAMQDNARAITLQKIHDSAAQHIAAQDTAAVETDLAL